MPGELGSQPVHVRRHLLAPLRDGLARRCVEEREVSDDPEIAWVGSIGAEVVGFGSLSIAQAGIGLENP